MEQLQEQVLENPFSSLDEAAKEITTVLARANVRHGCIGGYAVSLVGGTRMTDDIDIIIDADPTDARDLLLQANPSFRLTPSNKLVFVSGDNSHAVELLRGGRTRQLRLPDANTVSLLFVTTNDQPKRVGEIPIPIVTPPVLLLTKIKRWSFIVESTRPKSIRKAESDAGDILVLLKWLARHDLHIDWEGYPEKPKQELLSGVRKLYRMDATARPLLERTLKEEDLHAISN